MTTIERLYKQAVDMRCQHNLAPYAEVDEKAASELEALQKEVESWKNKFLDEAEIVNQIWTALRIKTFEEAKGKTIVEHVDSLRTHNQELRTLLSATREYVARQLKGNQDALKDADPDSQFYGEDIMSMPLLAKIDKALALKPEMPNAEANLKDEHKQRHIELHKCLDELAADWISKTGASPVRNTVLDLMKWSAKQRDNPE